MGVLGKLCHKHGGGALCHKHGGDALVYKSQAPEDATVEVEMGPVDWHCLTYDVDHVARVSCTAAFTAGSGTVTRTQGGSSDTSQAFAVHPNRGAAAEVTFSMRVTLTECSGPEDPGVHGDVVAVQGAASGTASAALPVGSDATVVVSFDASGRMTGVR